LSEAQIKAVYFATLVNKNAPLVFSGMRTSSDEKSDQNGFTFKVVWEGGEKSLTAQGTGPVDACMHAVEQIGLYFHLVEYTQQALDPAGSEFAAEALSEIKLQRKSAAGAVPEGPVVIGRGKDADTVLANVRALFSGMNLLLAG
jgi:2-isopropylmalate synthase